MADIKVTTDRGERPVSGFDSVIVKAPGWMYIELGSRRALNGSQLAKYLRDISEQQAKAIGEELHHANWVVTSDPNTVRTKGMLHDCAACRAGVDQALA